MTAFAGWLLVLGAAAVAIWWSLSNHMGFGPWLLAAFLLGHAIVHVMFAVPAPKDPGGPEWPFDPSKSWLIGQGIEASIVRTFVLGLAAVTVVSLAIAALATVGILVPPGLWRPAVALGATASAATLVLAFSPQLVLGLGIDAALLWIAVAGIWQP